MLTRLLGGALLVAAMQPLIAQQECASLVALKLPHTPIAIAVVAPERTISPAGVYGERLRRRTLAGKARRIWIGYKMLQDLAENSSEEDWLKRVDTPFFGTVSTAIPWRVALLQSPPPFTSRSHSARPALVAFPSCVRIVAANESGILVACAVLGTASLQGQLAPPNNTGDGIAQISSSRTYVILRKAGFDRRHCRIGDQSNCQPAQRRSRLSS